MVIHVNFYTAKVDNISFPQVGKIVCTFLFVYILFYVGYKNFNNWLRELIMYKQEMEPWIAKGVFNQWANFWSNHITFERNIQQHWTR
jgi:hypothetical protein